MQIPSQASGTGLTSTSLERAPASAQDFVRGKSGNVPFWPGGLDEALKQSDDSNGNTTLKGLRSKPPGFSRGLRFDEDGEDDDVVDIYADEIAETGSNEDLAELNGMKVISQANNETLGASEIDDLLPTSVRVFHVCH